MGSFDYRLLKAPTQQNQPVDVKHCRVKSEPAD